MSPSVLVIENYADLRSSIVEALERRKFSCDSVSSSEDAVVKLRDHDYETILIAPRVPIMDDPVIHYLAEHRPGEMRNVIVMSDPATPTGDCGALLEKPFTNDQLVRCIRERRSRPR
jgi:DNA-binding response OmpR family regulator